MGIADSAAARASLADALFSRTRQRVLGVVFGQPDRAFGIVELIGLVGAGSGAVQREVERLVRSGLVTIAPLGSQKRYQANRDAPIFQELHSIIEKTAGVPQVLQHALEPLRPKITFALLYGSVAKSTDTALSDIDVLVVSDELTLEELFRALQTAEERLVRRINPTLYTVAEFRKRRMNKNPFLTKLLDGKHIMLVGDDGGLAATR